MNPTDELSDRELLQDFQKVVYSIRKINFAGIDYTGII